MSESDKGRRDAPVRWRAEVGWELRCASCERQHRRRFWPLSHEFWDMTKGIRRCRKCIAEDERRRLRDKYHASAEYRERRKRQNRAAYAAMSSAERGSINAKRYQAHLDRMAEATEDERRRQREMANERQRRYRAKMREARGE